MLNSKKCSTKKKSPESTMSTSHPSPFSRKSYPFHLTQITLCYNAKKWEKLYEMINYLMNRRGQGKKAQIEMIQMAMAWLSSTAEPQRTKLIETVRDVCAKKIFLEVSF
jgi:hypothetical protein